MKFLKAKRSYIATVLISLMILLIAYWGLVSLDGTNETLQTQTLTDAITRSCTHSYATNGAYPTSIDEIVETYGIQIDEDRYIVHYEVFAPNILPDITVISR